MRLWDRSGIISSLAGGFRLKVAVRPELGFLAVIRGLLVLSAVRSFDFIFVALITHHSQ